MYRTLQANSLVNSYSLLQSFQPSLVLSNNFQSIGLSSRFFPDPFKYLGQDKPFTTLKITQNILCSRSVNLAVQATDTESIYSKRTAIFNHTSYFKTTSYTWFKQIPFSFSLLFFTWLHKFSSVHAQECGGNTNSVSPALSLSVQYLTYVPYC